MDLACKADLLDLLLLFSKIKRHEIFLFHAASIA
jgi:hypothetical protein